MMQNVLKLRYNWFSVIALVLMGAFLNLMLIQPVLASVKRPQPNLPSGENVPDEYAIKNTSKVIWKQPGMQKLQAWIEQSSPFADSLLWDEATRYTFAGTQHQLVNIPLPKVTDEFSTIFVLFDPYKLDFRGHLITIEQSGASEKGFTGSLTLSSLDGNPVMIGHFDDGELVSTNVAAEPNPGAVCFNRCFFQYVVTICGVLLLACLADPGTCVFALACLIPIYIACAIFCVINTGEEPEITTLPPEQGFVDVLYTYDPEATGDVPIVWSLVQGPSGMTVDPQTGLVEWTPNVEGAFNVTIQAENDFGGDTQNFAIQVSREGTAPTITSTPTTTGQVGVAYSYDAEASGDAPQTWSIVDGPTGLTINSNTGLVSWTPDQAGDFNVTIQVSNNFGSDTQSFTINVSPASQPPTITSTPVTSATVGVPYSYDAEATGDTPLTWSLTENPAGMTIDSNTGVVSWTPDQAGNADVTIEVSNSSGTDTQGFTISVSNPDTALGKRR